MKLEKKLKMLAKRYPDNAYSIVGSNIIRDKNKGRRPHKTKGGGAKSKTQNKA